jgi:hypothetical protein
VRAGWLVLVTGVLLYAESPAAKRWWSHVEFLADDKLQGRDTGSEGHREATRYVAAEFERAGLKAAGTSGYVQGVSLVSYTLDESQSWAELIFPDRTVRLRLGDQAFLSLRGNLVEHIDAPLVFTGYGFAVPEKNYDELAGLDLKGKVAVYMSGGPKNIPAPLLSHSQSGEVRWARLKEAGAVGVAVIGNPTNTDIPWERQRHSRLLPSMRLADVDRDGPGVALQVNPMQADLLLEGSEYSIVRLFELANSGRTLPKFSLIPRLRTRQVLRTSAVNSMNVIGVKQGAHPVQKNEYVVVSAHLDHIGVNHSLTGDQVFNGAMDNASGVATMIEIARALKGKTLSRSVLFAAVTGEEKGLLGSKYFALSPTVPREAIAADLNFDMFLPLFPLKRVIVYGKDESTLGETARRVAESMGIAVMADPDPLRNSFIRSDQYSFIQRGIPALAFKLGYEPNTPEERMFKGWLRERYHSVWDDLSQPVDKEAAARFNRLMTGIVSAVANEPERPHWKESSFFRRFVQ